MLIWFIMQKRWQTHQKRSISSQMLYMSLEWTQSVVTCYSRQPSTTAKPFSHKTPIWLATREEWSTICSFLLHFIKTLCLFARKHDVQSAFIFKRNHFSPLLLGCLKKRKEKKRRHCHGQFSMNSLSSDFFFFFHFVNDLTPTSRILFWTEYIKIRIIFTTLMKTGKSTDSAISIQSSKCTVWQRDSMTVFDFAFPPIDIINVLFHMHGWMINQQRCCIVWNATINHSGLMSGRGKGQWRKEQ